MRSAKVFYKSEEAGVLQQKDDGSYSFDYNNTWLDNPLKPSISLTLPKNQTSFQSSTLFPFFFNLLPEGDNKQVVCKLNRLEEDDYFGQLIVVGQYDTIGAVKVVELKHPK